MFTGPTRIQRWAPREQEQKEHDEEQRIVQAVEQAPRQQGRTAQAHAAYAGKDELLLEVVVLVAIGALGHDAACREHHDKAYAQEHDHEHEEPPVNTATLVRIGVQNAAARPAGLGCVLSLGTCCILLPAPLVSGNGRGCGCLGSLARIGRRVDRTAARTALGCQQRRGKIRRLLVRAQHVACRGLGGFPECFRRHRAFSRGLALPSPGRVPGLFLFPEQKTHCSSPTMALKSAPR